MRLLTSTILAAVCVTPVADNTPETSRSEPRVASVSRVDRPVPPTVLETAAVATAVDTATNANLAHKVRLLEQGEAFLAGITSYRATLTKQELVGDELVGEQTIEMKCRHEPFSVYLNWRTGDPGREVLYVQGANNDCLIAHDGGWKARIPAFSLAVNSPLALRDARYPVTHAGLLNLSRMMLAIHRNDLKLANVKECSLHPGEFDQRPCLVFTTVYNSSETSPTYRKSITMIDREWNLPVSTRHFEWPQSESTVDEESLDAETLIESYSFTGVTLSGDLTPQDFDRSNPDYRFR